MKHSSACDSLRPGQLNRLVDKIKDRPYDKLDKENVGIMRKEQITEALTAMIASAFTHHQKMMYSLNAEPPTSAESKAEYLNNPIIHALTDAIIMRIYELLMPRKKNTRD